MIFAVMGLSSASKQVTARSCGSGFLRRSTGSGLRESERSTFSGFQSSDATDDGGVWASPWLCTEPELTSEPEPSPEWLVDTEAVRSRLGPEAGRREPSLS
jgi:hypothetical protein